MTAARFIRAGVLLLAAMLFFMFCSYLFFPLARLTALFDSTLAGQGLVLAPHPRKTVIPGLAWEKPVLSSEHGRLFVADRMMLRPDWLALLTGTAMFSSDVSVNSGTIALRYGVTGATQFDCSVKDINLADIPFFKSALNAEAGGVLWSEGRVNRGKNGTSGAIRLEIKNLSLRGVRLGAFPLPDVSGLTAQGMVAISGGTRRLESVTLQGDGIYMRLSGDLPGSVQAPLALKLEIMPKPEFLEKQKLIFMLLAKFAVSPGVYQIPVKGTVLKPEIL